jgi:hypothetical protein
MLYMVLLLGVLLMLDVLMVSMMVRRNRRYVQVIEGMQRPPEMPFGG